MLTSSSIPLIICSRPKMSFITEDLCLRCPLCCCKDSLIMPLFVFIYLYCLYMGLSFPCPLKRERPGKSVSRERPSQPVGRSALGSPCSPWCPASDPILCVSRSVCPACWQTCPGSVLAQDIFFFWFFPLQNSSLGLNSANRKRKGKRAPKKGRTKENLTEVWGRWI